MARNFVGSSSQYLSRNNAIATGAPITMACWARVTNALAAQSFMSIQTTIGSDRFTLTVNATGNIVAAATVGGTTQAATTTGAMTNNTWAHCVAVFSSSTNRVAYLNGVASTASTVSSIPSSLTQFMIGARRQAGALGLYLTGQIAEAAIWNFALTASEINSLYQLTATPLQIRRDNLQAYWPLGGLYGDTDNDLSNNLYSLTATNSPTFTPHIGVNYDDQYNFWNPSESSPDSLIWINVGGTWKQGTPFIKQMGTWRQGIPKIKIGGNWK